MSILIPLIITAVAAAYAYAQCEHQPYWSLMPGLAMVAAGLVSGTSWMVWLLMTLFA